MSSQNEESNHEFNFFLDKQIQTKILDFTENEKLEVEIQSAVKVSKKLDYDFELCEWIPKKGFTPRKPEKDTKDNLEVKVHFSHRDRDGLLPNSLKTKQYNFKHYTDVSQYMLQYRLENSSTQNQSNRTKSGKQKKQILKSRQSSRQKDDSLTQLQNNSTDIKVVATLAYKYKLDPRVPNWPSSPESTVDIYSIEDGERKSARVPSARDTISARASGTINLTPTKGRSNTSSISSPTIGSAISTKSMHVTPQGMYNLDDRNGLPSSFITDLGTHETTSSVTSNGRQEQLETTEQTDGISQCSQAISQSNNSVLQSLVCQGTNMKVPKTDPFPNFGNPVLPLNESFDNNNNRALSVYKDRISVTSHNNKNNMADNCSVVSKDNTVIAEISKVTLQTDVLEEADSSMSRISNSTAEWPKDVSPCLAEDITEETHQRFDTGKKMADKSNLALDEKLLRLKLLDAKHNGVINNSTDYDIKYMIDKKQKTQNVNARLKKHEKKPPELEEPSSPLISKADRHKLNLLSHGSNRKKIAQHKCARKKSKNDQMVPSVETAHPKILIVENGCRGLADRAGYTVLSGFKRGPAVANGKSKSVSPRLGRTPHNGRSSSILQNRGRLQFVESERVAYRFSSKFANSLLRSKSFHGLPDSSELAHTVYSEAIARLRMSSAIKKERCNNSSASSLSSYNISANSISDGSIKPGSINVNSISPNSISDNSINTSRSNSSTSINKSPREFGPGGDSLSIEDIKDITKDLRITETILSNQLNSDMDRTKSASYGESKKQFTLSNLLGETSRS